MVTDAGALALSKDRGPVEFDPFVGTGQPLNLKGSDLGIRIDSLSQEHGEATAADSAAIERLKVGARVRVVPNHSCLTAAQHSHYNVIEKGQVVDRWEIQRAGERLPFPGLYVSSPVKLKLDRTVVSSLGWAY